MEIKPINPIIKKVEKEFLAKGVVKTKFFTNSNGAQSIVGYGVNNIPKYLFIFKSDGTKITKSYYTKFILLPVSKIEKTIAIVTETKDNLIKRIVVETHLGEAFEKIVKSRLIIPKNENTAYINLISRHSGDVFSFSQS